MPPPVIAPNRSELNRCRLERAGPEPRKTRRVVGAEALRRADRGGRTLDCATHMVHIRMYQDIRWNREDRRAFIPANVKRLLSPVPLGACARASCGSDGFESVSYAGRT